MNGLKKSGVTLNRKALAELAISDQKAFARSRTWPNKPSENSHASVKKRKGAPLGGAPFRIFG